MDDQALCPLTVIARCLDFGSVSSKEDSSIIHEKTQTTGAGRGCRSIQHGTFLSAASS